MAIGRLESVPLRPLWPNEAYDFDALHERKEAIEARFGHDLDWMPEEDIKACHITYTMDTGGWRDEERWPQVQGAMADAMVRLERALAPEIARLMG